jgi:S-adenosylmethionine:tRNA ribosyltransferase-isomerase
VGNAKRWKSGILQMPLAGGILEATLREKLTEAYLIQFSWQPATLTFAEILEKAGKIPLPPYLNRDAEESDKSRYQTIYAASDGAVAAPTAGLHFTPEVLAGLNSRGIFSGHITLHVGAGTFKPVKAAAMADHSMHAEEIYVSADFIRKLLAHLNGIVIPVGTTAMRTLESLYWLGVYLQQHPTPENLHVPQWFPYETEPASLPAAAVALQTLLDYIAQQNKEALRATTQVLIAPGYSFRICTGLITNFHQPESTLLLLVSALIGDRWRAVYQHALQHQYRFLSYGDSSLLLP